MNLRALEAKKNAGSHRNVIVFLTKDNKVLAKAKTTDIIPSRFNKEEGISVTFQKGHIIKSGYVDNYKLYDDTCGLCGAGKVAKKPGPGIVTFPHTYFKEGKVITLSDAVIEVVR
jgi:hypothetical protein